jgi:hypothetical protein
MSLEEKLSQLRTLLAQRDDIDRQLEAIIGHYGPKQVETRQRKWHKADKRGKELQREITRDHAPGTKKQESYRFDEFKAVPRGTPKPCCGSKGARHFKTCPLNGKETIRTFAPEQPKKESSPLDGFQYEALRDAMHDRDFSSAEYALTNRLSPREVNAAIKSADYDDYLDSL